MTFGGLPRRTLRSWKSESFETIVNPPRPADSQMASSSALSSPQECAWIDRGNSLCSTSARRGGRFSSNRRFTLFAIPVCVRGGRRTPGRHGYLPRSDRELAQDFLVAHPTGQIFQHIINRDAQPSDAGLSPALPRLQSDDFGVVHAPITAGLPGAFCCRKGARALSRGAVQPSIPKRNLGGEGKPKRRGVPHTQNRLPSTPLRPGGMTEMQDRAGGNPLADLRGEKTGGGGEGSRVQGKRGDPRTDLKVGHYNGWGERRVRPGAPGYSGGAAAISLQNFWRV
jgi:hypothetical protein